MDLAPGYRVTPKVRLVRPLGKGAMGAVWVASHDTLDTEVAVKFITDEFQSRRADALERFRREATAAARIKSPHVVQMLDHGVTEDGIPYIIMELLEGEPLSDRIKRDGTLSLKETGQVGSMCAALSRRRTSSGSFTATSSRRTSSSPRFTASCSPRCSTSASPNTPSATARS